MTKHLAFLVGIGVTTAFFVNLCAFVFECGCRSLWNGIATLCNIHQVAGPHCPWCEHPLLGGGVAFVATLSVQWAACYLPKGAGFAKRLVLGLLAFPITSGLVAWVQGHVWDYWAR